MDYTQSNSFVTDAGTTQRMHLAAQAVPTAVSDNDMNQVIWELMEIVKAGGQVGAPFDKAVPATYQKLLTALRAAGVFTTPAQFDNTTRAATAAFVRTFGASFSDVLTVSAAGALANASVGGNVKLAGATYTSTLPLASAVPAGGRINFHVTATGAVTLARAGADTLSPPVGAAVTLLALAAGDTLELTSNGVSAWVITGGSLALAYASGFGSSAAASGYQRLPNGLIIQWGALTNTGATDTVTFPIAFPNSVWSVVAGQSNGAGQMPLSVVTAITLSNFTLKSYVGAPGAVMNAAAAGQNSCYYFAVGK